MKRLVLILLAITSMVACTKLSLDGDDDKTPKTESGKSDTTNIKKGLNIIHMRPAPVYGGE